MQRYLEKAEGLIIGGFFPSKAAQKEACSLLNSAYNELESEIRKTILNSDFEKSVTDGVYYDLPFDLHQWRATYKERLLALFPELKAQTDGIDRLYLIRETYKQTEIRKLGKQVSEVEKMEAKLREMIRQNYTNLPNGGTFKPAKDIFAGLNVHTNWHFCSMYSGTVYMRIFYYLNGSVISLGKLMGIAEAKKKEEASKGETWKQ